LPGDNTYSPFDAEGAIHHKLAKVILYAYEAGFLEPVQRKRGIPSQWNNIISRYGILIAPELTFRSINTDWEDLPDKKE
jgi:hypothetical protein